MIQVSNRGLLIYVLFGFSDNWIYYVLTYLDLIKFIGFLFIYYMWALYIKFGLILVVDLCLCIKLGLKYEILNLDPFEYILICQFLNFGESIWNLGQFIVSELIWNLLIWARLVDNLYGRAHFNYLIWHETIMVYFGCGFSY